jgi:crotonobetainyl-CoA:carnitine CoA-transferase CaiB-like acyl-CoA transferase
MLPRKASIAGRKNKKGQAMATVTGQKEKGPLTGLKVIDLSHVMAGPTCAMLLADMGADVIKVEKLPGGDDSRRMVPPTISGESAAFLIMNRNKRGIALDLKTEAGRRVLSRLLRDADVLIENYRRGTMERMGFGYDALHALNPGLIYCSISGFGRTGPYADRGGFDLVAQGMSGLMSITGEGPGCPPVKLGAPVTDITAGILGCVGVLAALHARASSGQGQMVDTSLFEAGIMQTYWQSAICFATGQAPGPMGTAHPLNAPYQAFPVDDGWITVGAANQGNWLRLLEALGAPEMAHDPRFANNAERMRNLPALQAALTPLFKGRSSAEWLHRLEQAGVPAGPVLDVGQMHADPQALAREMIVKTTHPTAGQVAAIGLPIKFSETPGCVRRAAPVLGQHTREVLREHGFSDAEADQMAALGAIKMTDASKAGTP